MSLEALSYAPATGALSSFWLLIAIPLASATFLLLFGKYTNKWGHWLGVLALLASFVLALFYFSELRHLGSPPAGVEARSAELNLWNFFSVGSLKVSFGLLLDPLAAIFVLLITGVGLLIHVYAVGYMSDDPGRRRFFGYFNLFVAAMLTLVLANNYVMLYLGWEGVGLASYLLISWYFNRPSAATAGKKAFIMNRVGDAGMAVAIFIMFATFGSVSFSGVFTGVTHASSGDGPVDRAVPSARRVQQVRSGAAAGLVAGRDGRPDPGLGPDPRRDDGDRRCLPDRPVRPDLQREPRRADVRRLDRCVHAGSRVHHRLREGRHQAHPRVLDGVPDRVHVPRGRPGRRRVRAGPDPPARARLLQGRTCSSAPAR